MRKNTNTQLHWDGIWKKEGRDTWRQYPVVFKRVIELIRPGTKLVDLGCGNGVFLGRLDRMRAGMLLTGIDISPVAIEQLWTNHHIAGSVAALPDLGNFPESELGTYDYVTMLDVLEHIDHEAAAVAAAFSLLKPGGQFILVVPEKHDPVYKEHIRTHDGEHVRWYDEERVINALTYYGWDATVELIEGDPNVDKVYLGRSRKR